MANHFIYYFHKKTLPTTFPKLIFYKFEFYRADGGLQSARRGGKMLNGILLHSVNEIADSLAKKEP